MTDEQIIKGLEWCDQSGDTCECCEYRQYTDPLDICPIKADALDLINRQQVEIEQLKRNLEQCENGYSQELHFLQCKLVDAESKAILARLL